MTPVWEAARLREAVPDWLAEIVRLHRAPVPWAAMVRAAMAQVSANAATAPTAAVAPGAGAGAPVAPDYLAGAGLLPRSQLRRKAFRALSDLRAEFQRTMSEPSTVSCRATAWWPALVGLEEVTDVVTATAVAISRGAPAPSPYAVRQLSATLGAVAGRLEGGEGRSYAAGLPADPPLKPVTEAVRSVLTVLADAKPPALAGN